MLTHQTILRFQKIRFLWNQFLTVFFYIILGAQTISAYFTLPKLRESLGYVSYLHSHTSLIFDILKDPIPDIGFAVFSLILGLGYNKRGRDVLLLLAFDILWLTIPLFTTLIIGNTHPKLSLIINYGFYIIIFITFIAYTRFLKWIYSQIGVSGFLKVNITFFIVMMAVSALSMWIGKLNWAESSSIIAFWLFFSSTCLYMIDYSLSKRLDKKTKSQVEFD